MKQTPRHSASSPLRSPLWGMGASILLVAVILAVLISLGAHEQVVLLLQWFEKQGIWAPLLFVLVMAAAVVLVLPGVLLTAGAGFVFGVLEGSICVVVGTTLGATAAFLIARYLFGEHARRFVLRHAKLRVVSKEMAPHGWKIVLLTRLIPFFPSKISNYLFGLTSFSLRGFVGGSLVGFVPYSVHNVYLGSIAADIFSLSEGGLVRSPVQWALYGAGFVATVVAVVYFSRLARRALGRLEEQGDVDGELP